MAQPLKQQRNYRLTIQPPVGDTIVIQPPFTLEFDISRNTLQSTNTASIRILNLAKSTRTRIYKDDFTYELHIPVQLEAGYGSILSTIFKGNIQHAWSVREGVNVVTTMEAFDGGDALINSTIDQIFKNDGKTTTADILKETLKTFSERGVVIGKIGNQFTDKITRGQAVSGTSADIAAAISNGGFFVDLEKAYALADNECLLGSLDTIDSSSGLLGTPVREKTKLMIDLIFEPRVIMAQLITLKSSTSDGDSNRLYKVMSIHHRGVISDAVCGDATTTLGLWQGIEALKVVS